MRSHRNPQLPEEMLPGVIYIVGAGPSDPALITVRGLHLLRQADVVLYDRLAPRALLKETSPECEHIYVGKEPGGHAMPQETIIDLMIQLARSSKRVVRLKGGDPYVFGRGSEEALALRAAGIPFYVVPGISSAIAVPAAAGIPLTHQHLARGFVVITGHTRHETLPSTQSASNHSHPLAHLDLKALAAIDTIVVLMGVTILAELSEALITVGRSPDTPVAIIENGTTAEERMLCGRLADIAELASEAKIHPPATIVIGNVVALQPALLAPDSLNRHHPSPMHP